MGMWIIIIQIGLNISFYNFLRIRTVFMYKCITLFNQLAVVCNSTDDEQLSLNVSTQNLVDVAL